MSRWSLWGAERGWADVGLWVAVCFLAKISSHRPTCKTTFARLTQSQAISQSFRVFISFTSRRDTTFFHFSKLFFIQNYRFLYHGDQKIWWTSMQAGSQLRNRIIHLWSSGKNADCIFVDRSASSMSKWRPAWTLTPEMIPFRTKSVMLSMLIDLLTSSHYNVVQCHVGEDRINWPLTSRDVYFFGNACAGRVGKQFRYLRLSKEAWGLLSD